MPKGEGMGNGPWRFVSLGVGFAMQLTAGTVYAVGAWEVTPSFPPSIGGGILVF
jgi:hypothetical protein